MSYIGKYGIDDWKKDVVARIVIFYARLVTFDRTVHL